MSTLICMAIFDTEQNNRSNYTAQSLDSLLETTDFNKHRLFLSDNGSCEDTQNIYEYFKKKFSKSFPIENLTIRKNGRNLGTANAINLGWRTRRKGEFVTKQDNDFTVDQKGWVDVLEESLIREPLLGCVGLKRFDLEEHPLHTVPDWKTKLVMLPHKRGERWIVAEQCNGVFGTMQMYRSEVIDKIGYLRQPKTGYGFDDTLMNMRCKAAGYAQAYIPQIEINYLDIDENPYWDEKRKLAGEGIEEFNQMKEEILDGHIFYEPNWETLD